MKFNNSYNFISLVVLLIITIKYFRRHRFPAISNTIFGSSLILGDLDIIFDIISSMLISNVIVTPVAFDYIFNSAYYVSQLLLSASFLLYLIALIDNYKKIYSEYYFVTLIPLIVCMIILFIGLPNGKIFTITESGEYIYGPLSNVTYICVGLYLLITLFLLAFKSSCLTSLERSSMFALCGFVIAAATIQFMYPEQLLTGTAISISLMIMFFTVQDPAFYLDNVARTFTGDAMKQLYDYYYARKRNFHIAAIKLHGIHNMHMLYGRRAGNASLKNTGEFLSSFKKGKAFHAGDGLFLIMFHTKEELDTFVEKFNEFKTVPQVCDTVKLTQRYTLLAIDNCKKYRSTRELMSIVENAFDDVNIANIKLKSTRITDNMALKYQTNVIIEDGVKNDLQKEKNFVMKYQPIYSLKKKTVVGLEALVRYNNDILGQIRPGDFIPLVEEKGLSLQFDEFATKLVFKDIKSGVFKDTDVERIHINISAATFSYRDTIKRIIDLAKEYEIDTKKVVFEITETASTLSEESVKESSRMIREAGFGLALDDFGVGHSSIQRAIQLPLTDIKFDKSLVQDASHIITNLVDIFNKQKVSIIAEGVETTKQKEAVIKAGIDEIQGYYYSTPVYKEEVAELIKMIKDH